jgi:hypothetical protein
VTTPWAACVLIHWRDADRPRRAVDGLQVCLGCHAKTLRALVQLAPLHRLLGEIRAVATAAPRNGSRSAELPIPLHPAAADHRRAIRQHLAGWVVDTCETRRLTTPAIDAAHGSQPAADALVGWLLPWHDWILAQPYADDYATDLSELHSAAWAIAYPSGRVRRDFAPCPTPDCQGTLAAWLAPGDLLPAALVCEACGEEVPPARWLTGRAVSWLTALELAHLWDVPLKTIERWARVAGWPSAGVRPARYDSNAAQRTFDAFRGVPASPLTQVDAMSHAAASIDAL